jgi:hypothetical protein
LYNGNPNAWFVIYSRLSDHPSCISTKSNFVFHFFFFLTDVRWQLFGLSANIFGVGIYACGVVDWVIPVIVIQRTAFESDQLSGRSPGKRTLVNFVRPQILRKFSSFLMTHNGVLAVQLHQPDVKWTDPVSLIAVSQF